MEEETVTNAVNTRALVLEMLMEINENGEYSHLVLRSVLEKYQYLSKQERAFMTRLVEGTLEHQIELDYILNSFSKTKVKKMKPVIRNILRMGVYQLLYMDAIPDSAVCNEAVKLSKKRGLSQLSGFVNGLLRNIARNKKDIAYPDSKKDFASYLEVTYSLPKWMVEKWIASYGEEQTQKIAKGFYMDAPLSIRTNTTKITPEELKVRLEQEGVSVSAVEGMPYAFDISDFDYLQGLSSFREGLFYVQDLSSMQVAKAAEVKENDYVIDVCAAPGGKSTHLAELLKGTGMVEARDLTEAKVDLIRENMNRQDLSNMMAVVWDATKKHEDSIRKADVLICDLPCSGLGIMGKKTDIRYKMNEETMDELVDLQRQILDVVWEYVKPNGTLVYSTCTINKDENEDNVAWFLENHKEFSLEYEKQFLPGESTHDGFFLAKLTRQGE